MPFSPRKSDASISSKMTDDVLAIVRLNSQADRRDPLASRPEAIELWNTTFHSANIPIKSTGSRSDL